MEKVDWQRRRDILICVICIGIIAWVVWLLVSQFVEAIFILLLAMAIAFLITPMVNALARWHIPRVLAAIISYLIVLAALFGLGYAMVFSLVSQAQQFSDTVVNFVRSAPDTFGSFINFLLQHGVSQDNINNALTQIQNQVTAFANDAVLSVPTIIIFITNTFLNFLILMVISFYLTIDGKRIRDSIFSIMPKRSMPHALLFEDALNRVVGNYIRGQLTLAVIIGVATTVVCVFAGLPEFALVFGVLGFLFETIPMVGPGLASISPLLASLLLPDPFPRTIIILACFVAIQMIESNVLGPRIVGHAVGLHPVASIMALLVFAKLFGSTFGAFGGAVGALVATPIVAAAWVVVASVYRSARGETADQIMARKRAPWTVKRPTMPSALHFPSSGHRGGTGKPKSAIHTDFFPDTHVKDESSRSIPSTTRETREDLVGRVQTTVHDVLPPDEGVKPAPPPLDQTRDSLTPGAGNERPD